MSEFAATQQTLLDQPDNSITDDQPAPLISWPDIPVFRPHPFVRGGHAQTLCPLMFRQKCPPYRATQHRVQLQDGDHIVLHDDCPEGWSVGDRAVLLIHGLAGCHMSGYMERLSHKLPTIIGARTFRMDLRTCGAGEGLATLPYHAGITEDVHDAIGAIERLCGNSPLAVVGFSMSGNLVLKMLGEAPEDVSPIVDRAMAVNPPVDLDECSWMVKRGFSRVYDRHWGKKLVQLYKAVPPREGAESHRPAVGSRVAGIREFDDVVTAKLHGFGTVENYYGSVSANQFASHIRVPTLVISSADDPMISRQAIEGADWSSFVKVHIAESGGHVGYVAGKTDDPDRRWIDWRVIDWVRAEVRQ